MPSSSWTRSATRFPLADRMAPEHLHVCARDGERIAAAVRNAGAVFVGTHAAEVVGDYVAGPSHVLPTGGGARFSSGLSVLSFMKRTSVIRAKRRGGGEARARHRDAGARRRSRGACVVGPHARAGRRGGPPVSESRDRLASIELDDTGLPTPTAEVEQERRVAIYDLLGENRFRLLGRDGGPAPGGPYELLLAVRDRHLVLRVTAASGEPTSELHLALSPFRNVVKDYYAIVESYYDAIRRLPPHKIEAIDMGRRGVHDEGARLLLDRLAGKIEIDLNTARRLFTLVCVLHFRG